jgi:acyl-CoA synthetase
VQLLRQWKSKENSTDIFSLYGITEVSCCTTVHKVEIQNEAQSFDCDACETQVPSQQGAVPLGNALSQTLLSVKNDSGVEIFTGEGELYIGSMERMYLIDSETVQNLHFPLYRATGDIVKVDGCNKRVFYVGCKDNMIKWFGHKLSLEHVQQVVAAYRGIEHSQCVWEAHTRRLGLLAKVEQSKDEDQHFTMGLKCHFRKHLQPPFIPDVIVKLKCFPLSSHGKLDHFMLKCLL